MVLRPPPHTCRVISAEAKAPAQLTHAGKLTMAGVLEVGGGARYSEVREGVLQIYGDGPQGQTPHWRVPLRGLHLLPAAPLGLAFALASPGDQRPTLTFRVKTELDYERWVKCLAVELMRQTPLDRVRFLDILGITGSLRRARSAECVAPPPDPPAPHPILYRKRSQLQDITRDLPPCSRRSRSRKKELKGSVVKRGQSLEPTTQVPENPPPEVSELLSKCQRSDVYVPVKEKRRLFESLWRQDGDSQRMTRTQSLHDLSPVHHPVRDIARYFEMKTSPPPPGQTRIINMRGVSLDNAVLEDGRSPILVDNIPRFMSLCNPAQHR